MRLALAFLFLPLAALGQSYTVTVGSSGVLRYPTNFFEANSNAIVAVVGSGGGGGSGTVTSVALTVPSGFTVSGSPITSSGTIAISGTLATTAGGTGITNTTAAGQALLAAANAAAQRTELGLGTSATLDVPASGDAASGDVVKGNDSRLTDARTPTTHAHAASDVTSGVFATARLASGTATSSNFVRGDGSWAQVTTNDVPGLVAALAAGGGGTGGTKTIASFRAQQDEPPASNYATFSTRNSIGVLLYDHTTEEGARFRFVVPEGYTNTTADVVLKWTTSATSGNGRWGAQAMALTGDIDSDSFDTAVEATTTTSGTAGTVMTTTLSAVSLDGAVAGDWVWLRVYRDASDTVEDTINANDLELHSVEVRKP